MTEDRLLAFEEPPQKRSRVDQFGTNVPFTSITRPQELARVKSVFQAIYTNADDEALLNLGHGEINALNESWLEVSIFSRVFVFYSFRPFFRRFLLCLTCL